MPPTRPPSLQGDPDFAGELQHNLVVECWHAAPQSRETLAPFTHVGSKAAALARAETMHGDFVLHEVRLVIGTALRIPDTIGSTHRLGGVIECLETELQLPFEVVDELLMHCRSEMGDIGTTGSIKGGAMVADVLMSHGVDALFYENAVEDVGSTSWVIVDVSRAQIVDRTAGGQRFARGR